MTRRRGAAGLTLAVGRPHIEGTSHRNRVHETGNPVLKVPRHPPGSTASLPALSGKTGGWSRGPVRRLPRLAVMPLRGYRLAPKDTYLAVGLTDELISVLSQIRGLRVISHTSVSQYRGTSKPVAQVGVELGADSVLSGRVRRSGDQLEVAVQLVDPTTDHQTWAQTFERPFERVAAIPAEVAESAAGFLNIEVRGAQLDAIRERPTTNLTAYECYLRGIEAWHRSVSESGDPETLGRVAWECFEQAIAMDPRFSAAYASLAHVLLAMMGANVPTAEVAPRIRELVARALELDPRSADAHAAHGNLLGQADHDWRGSEAALRMSIALNPSSSIARFWYGGLLLMTQRVRESRRQYRITVDLDPLWVLPRLNLVWADAWAGSLDAAIAESERTTQRFPERDCARVQGAWVYAFAQRRDDALRLVEPWAGTPDPDVRWNPLAVQAYLGQPAPARKMLRDWVAGRLSGHLDPVGAAALYALVGEPEPAIELLEKVYHGREFTSWGDYEAPWYDRIRQDPRCVALLRAQRLPTTLSRSLMLGAKN